MYYCNDFSHDLQLGNEGERLTELLFAPETKLEVKTDLQAYITGNIFIEYESRGKKSGLAKSEADFWVFIVSSDHRYFIKSERLKIICRKYIGTGRDILGGDNNTSKGILLPLFELTNIDNMDYPPDISLEHKKR